MPMRRLHVRLLVDPARARRWHASLAGRLLADGHAVTVAVRRGALPPPMVLDLLLRMERLLFARGGPGPSAPLTIDALPRTAGVDTAPDLDVDLAGATGREGARVLTPLFDGAPVEEAAAAALLARRHPDAGVRDSAAPEAPLTARVAIEDPLRLVHALDGLCARLVTLVADAVETVAHGDVVRGRRAVPPPRPWSVADDVAALPREASRALTRLLRRPPHWFVGWRHCVDDRLSLTFQLPDTPWRRIPDDGARFLADPFPVLEGGRTYVFVEEFPYATGRGIVSVVPFGPDGPTGPARPVLEEPWHLSYPFVFKHDGQWWMIPEASASNRIDLYRAVGFPHRWERVGALVDDIAASDATIHHHDDGRLYMFATVAGGGASSWDALAIWWADRLAGPWRRVGGEALLVDAAAARPAGHLFRRGGALYRPVQDCSTGYGRALGFARIDRLDPDGFAQTVEVTIDPPKGWACSGFHTLNWCSGLETVDGCEPRRWRR